MQGFQKVVNHVPPSAEQIIRESGCNQDSTVTAKELIDGLALTGTPDSILDVCRMAMRDYAQPTWRQVWIALGLARASEGTYKKARHIVNGGNPHDLIRHLKPPHENPNTQQGQIVGALLGKLTGLFEQAAEKAAEKHAENQAQGIGLPPKREMAKVGK